MSEPLRDKKKKSVQPTAHSSQEGFSFSWSAANLFLSHATVWKKRTRAASQHQTNQTPLWNMAPVETLYCSLIFV